MPACFRFATEHKTKAMERLQIAIQKSGRLNQDSINLLKDSGIDLDTNGEQLKTPATNFPIDLLLLRNDDIAQYLEDGVADLAIVGQNLLMEKKKKVAQIRPLNFSKCYIALAIPKDTPYQGLSYFNGKKIATSYPQILQEFLAQNQIQASIHVIT